MSESHPIEPMFVGGKLAATWALTWALDSNPKVYGRPRGEVRRVMGGELRFFRQGTATWEDSAASCFDREAWEAIQADYWDHDECYQTAVPDGLYFLTNSNGWRLQRYDAEPHEQILHAESDYDLEDVVMDWVDSMLPDGVGLLYVENEPFYGRMCEVMSDV